MRFINQGIRQIRWCPQATANDSTQRTFLIFTEYYERLLLNAMKNVVENYGAKYRELDSISQLLDFINLRLSTNLRVRSCLLRIALVKAKGKPCPLALRDPWRFGHRRTNL